MIKIKHTHDLKTGNEYRKTGCTVKRQIHNAIEGKPMNMISKGQAKMSELKKIRTYRRQL
jgi:hypothetical protein